MNSELICFPFLVNPRWIQVKLNGDAVKMNDDASDLNSPPVIALAVGLSVLSLILMIIIAVLCCVICRYMSSHSNSVITFIIQ